MIAGIYFRLRGYRILARRYKTPMGEIDLVIARRGVVAFVEVKARETMQSALEAVHEKNRMRVQNAALHFIARHPELGNMTMRFDVWAVVLWRGFVPVAIRHLDNAWLSG